VRPVAATAEITPTRIGSSVIDDVHVRMVPFVDDVDGVDDEPEEKRDVTLSHGEWTG
jgi:hypothetical protein